jgi:hypothetical protein
MIVSNRIVFPNYSAAISTCGFIAGAMVFVIVPLGLAAWRNKSM